MWLVRRDDLGLGRNAVLACGQHAARVAQGRNRSLFRLCRGCSNRDSSAVSRARGATVFRRFVAGRFFRHGQRLRRPRGESQVNLITRAYRDDAIPSYTTTINLENYPERGIEKKKKTNNNRRFADLLNRPIRHHISRV